MFIEIFIYLVIAFGILSIAIIGFEKEAYIDEKYILMKREEAKVKIKVEISGLEENDVKDIEWILKRGKYEDIYDIADEIEVINEDKKRPLFVKVDNKDYY